MIHPIDAYVGMTKFFMNLDLPCKGSVPRPKGFKVIELSTPLPGPYYVYSLLKENLDTFHAVGILKKRFGGKWKWLGLKDSNAITLQLVSSSKFVEPWSFRHGKRCLVLRPLGLGKINKDSLSGNLFVIDIELECETSAFSGRFVVPGYFSYQRFGTTRPVSHVVGKLVLRRDWEEAIDVLLGEPTPWESRRARELRLKYYEEGPKAFLKAPRFLDVEREVAKKLLKGESPERALRSLNVFKVFLHAYQAYLYNKALSTFEDPCEGPRRLPGPGAREYEDLLWEEGVDYRAFEEFGLRAEPRQPCAETEIKAFAKGRTLTLVFALPRGYYATTILRELIKNPFNL